MLSDLPIHDKLKNLDLDNAMMDFDATNLYPSAIWEKYQCILEQKLDLLLNLI